MAKISLSEISFQEQCCCQTLQTNYVVKCLTLEYNGHGLTESMILSLALKMARTILNRKMETWPDIPGILERPSPSEKTCTVADKKVFFSDTIKGESAQRYISSHFIAASFGMYLPETRMLPSLSLIYHYKN